MGIRETLNKNPAVTTGATIAVIVIVLGWIVYAMWFQDDRVRGTRKGFYTVDDGATVFVDSPGKIAPFDHNGQPAVIAYVYTCDGGKNTWVGFLEKYSDAAMKRIDKMPRSETGMVDQDALNDLHEKGAMVRAPGAGGKWVLWESDAGKAVRSIKCPHGDSKHDPERWYGK